MACNGSHSALSGAIAMTAYQISSLSFGEKAAAVAIASTIGHFVLDVFPHGHTGKKWKELISVVLVMPLVLLVAFFKGGLELFGLALVALFFGNLFDALTEIGLFTEFNLFIHWFVRSNKFMAKYNVRKPVSVEQYKGKPVFSWKFGWYNFIPLLLSLIVFYCSL